ncbi:hypothetical protein D3C84_804520 [compost metagenome]
MSFLIQHGVNTSIELGPSHVLRNMMRHTFPKVHSYAYDKEEDAGAIASLLRAAPGPCFLSRCLAIAVCTKNYNSDDDEYQEGVVIPYRRVQNMLQEIKKHDGTPSLEQKRDALEMLRSVFITKRTPVHEQQTRFRQLYEETHDTIMLMEASRSGNDASEGCSVTI